ncbi:hypothetical protein KCU61_g99, partial [Aureobasidium melanogenum]
MIGSKRCARTRLTASFSSESGYSTVLSSIRIVAEIRDKSTQIVIVAPEIWYDVIGLHRLPECVCDVFQTKPACEAKYDAVINYTQSSARSFALVEYLDCVQKVAPDHMV